MNAELTKPETQEKARTGREWANSTLVTRFDVTPDLAVFRVQPDERLFEFRPGQYAVIGLPTAAPRCASADPEGRHANVDPGKPIVRPYSIASSSKVREYVDFYITLLQSGELTPRLWMLKPGDRLLLGPKAKGHFTMDDVPPGANVVLVGTGTGLAPYIAMIRDHHRCNSGRRFVVVHGARYVQDLGFRDELEALDRDCDTLVYLPTISRPYLSTKWRGHVGYVQSVFRDGSIEHSLGEPLTAHRTHVFVSGNSEMVEELQNELIETGFVLNTPHSPGTLHVERYW